MEIMEQIKQQVEGASIVLYMKGTPQFPMCGFSAQVVEALKAAGAADYASYNVLEEPELRANLPKYSDWPTFPQLYVNGELVGGCDITIELFQSGELQKLVESASK